MRAVQRMARVDIVIEMDRRPCIGGVTGLASSSEVTLVVVVFQVTGNTGDIHLVVERILAVAVTAGQLGMVAVQGESRVTRMIELGVFPAGRRVAITAFLSTATVVGVILGVAVEAGRWRRLERLVFVATGALGFRVLPDQREAGRVVIELHVGPGDSRMAVGALRTHGIAVHVVRFVAGKAV